ncbi:MAG: metallophosphoesterase family protein [Methylocystis sp.]|nr:metallophosphoesterase family protein [Methylocystis sp.]
MKLALISDIHANLEALQATLDEISARGVDRIVCLGDIVGYNANPAECIALLQQFDALCIAGNHDRAVCGQIGAETFSNAAARAVAWTRARLGADALDFLGALPLTANIQNRLLMVHGALHPDTGCETVRLDTDERRLLSFAALAAHPSGARICAFGHTHQPAVYEFRSGQARLRLDDEVFLHDDAHYLINPGAVGQPRTTDRRATYMILDIANRTVNVCYVEYDASAPLAKTRKAGLAPPFSFLPAPVQRSLKRGLRALGLYESVKRIAG